MKTINIGLIGCGTVTLKVHVPALMVNPQAKLSAYCFRIVALCGLDSENIEYLNTILPHAKVFTDYRELVDSELCDAVLVATGEELHPQISEYAARKDLFVLCEKPFATSVTQIEDLMHSLPVEQQAKIQVAFNKRFYPVYSEIQRYIQDGSFGRPRAGLFHFFTQSGRKAGWQGILSNMIHHCDLICAIFGEISEVSGHVSINEIAGIETYSYALSMQSIKGAAISMFFSTAGAWNAPIHEEWQLVDDQRNRIVCRNSNEFSFFGANGLHRFQSNTNSIFWLADVTGYQAQLKAFYELCCSTSLVANPSLHDALQAQSLFEMIQKAFDPR